MSRPERGSALKKLRSRGALTKAVFLLLPYSIRKQEPIRAAWKKTDSNDWQSASRVTRTTKYRKGNVYRQA